jgi:hypothetical protein
LHTKLLSGNGEIIFTFSIRSLISRGRTNERENKEVGERERGQRKSRKLGHDGNTVGSKQRKEENERLD